MLKKSWELGRKFFQIFFFSIFQCVLSMYWAVSMCASLILTLLNGIKWEILFVLHNTLKKLNSLIFITIHAKCIYNKHWHGRSNRVYHGNPLFTFTSKKVARVISLKNVLYFVAIKHPTIMTGGHFMQVTNKMRESWQKCMLRVGYARHIFS